MKRKVGGAGIVYLLDVFYLVFHCRNAIVLVCMVVVKSRTLPQSCNMSQSLRSALRKPAEFSSLTECLKFIDSLQSLLLYVRDVDILFFDISMNSSPYDVGSFHRQIPVLVLTMIITKWHHYFCSSEALPDSMPRTPPPQALANVRYRL